MAGIIEKDFTVPYSFSSLMSKVSNAGLKGLEAQRTLESSLDKL